MSSCYIRFPFYSSRLGLSVPGRPCTTTTYWSRRTTMCGPHPLRWEPCQTIFCGQPMSSRTSRLLKLKSRACFDTNWPPRPSNMSFHERNNTSPCRPFFCSKSQSLNISANLIDLKKYIYIYPQVDDGMVAIRRPDDRVQILNARGQQGPERALFQINKMSFSKKNYIKTNSVKLRSDANRSK